MVDGVVVMAPGEQTRPTEHRHTRVVVPARICSSRRCRSLSETSVPADAMIVDSMFSGAGS